ncbi:uncharacterized protein LOC144885086 isoform X2 [Branchiostoma floridae x Branchiostoma japonicum]
MASLRTVILLLIAVLSGNCALGGYTYVGCYADSDSRVLPYAEHWDIFQSTANCVNHCRKKGYEYAGTEFSWQCFCGTGGNFASLAPAVSDDACNMACPGEPSENCGGTWRISVHAVLALSNEARLVGGMESDEGRLEVRLENTVDWGTVCSQGFDMNDAEVACRMLNLGAPVNFTDDTSYYGPGTGDIKMASLECSGNETSLFSCPYLGTGHHSCSHSNDVGLLCHRQDGDDDGSGMAILIGVFSGFGAVFATCCACTCILQKWIHRRAINRAQQQAMEMNQINPYPTQDGQPTQLPHAYGQYTPEPTQYGQYTQPAPPTYGQCIQDPTQYGQYTQPPAVYGQYAQDPTQYGQYTQQPTAYGHYAPGPTQFDQHIQQTTQYGMFTQQPTQYGQLPQQPTQDGQHPQPPLTQEGTYTQ